MARQTLLKSTLCLLMALVCGVAWAQTNTDGPIVTFTNVQKDGTTFILYINENNELAISNSSAAELGDAAKFRATQQANSKWTFYNEAKQLYMIWKGSDGGYNGNKGVLAEYNSTYCDWTINSGSSSIADTYYLMGKRSDGSTNGTPVITHSGSFDKWTSGIALATNYSNLFKIEGEEYTATLTDTKGVVHECTAKGLPLSGATITNPVWKSGNLTADVAFTIPVSTEEVTNRVIIGSFNDFNNKYFADGTSVKANRNSSAPLPSNVDVKNYLWAFYPTLEGSVFKFKIKNIGTGTYIKSEAVENDHSGDEVSLVAEAEATPFALTALNQLVNTKGYRLSNGSTSGSEIKYIGTYNTDHNGTKNKIVDANNYTLTLSDETIYEGTNGVHNLMGGSYTYSNGAWSDNGYSATVNFAFSSLPFPVSSAEVTNPTMISSFKTGGDGLGRFKWYALDDADDVVAKRDVAATHSTLKNFSWAIYATLENGAFAYSIKNVAKDKWIYSEASYTTDNGSHGDNVVILSDTPAKFKLTTDGENRFYYVSSVNQYLSLNSTGTADAQQLGIYAKAHNGTTNSFHAPSYDLTSKDELVSGGIYAFVTSRGWVGANDGDVAIATVKTSVTPAASTDNVMFQWALYQSKNGNYYLYNLGKQKFLGVPSQDMASIPLADEPMGKNLTFKDIAGATSYPIMFSPNNTHAVSQNANAGLFGWAGGWNKTDDAGSNHNVTYIGALTADQLKTIADLVEAYDRRLYVKAEVEGSWEGNPNTHYGRVRATSSAGAITTKLNTDMDVVTIDYDGLNETTIDFTRDYRGFEFQGYSFGGVDLGKSFTLTDEQKASITAENPLVAKFRATEDVTLFYDDDVKSYRIPAIGKTSTGRLIAVSDYRHNLDDIGMDRGGTGSHRIDLVIRTSDNNGKTWSSKQTIAEGTDVRNADDCAFGDAAIAVVGQKVLVMAAAGDVIFANGTADAHNRTWRVYSEDNGVTWAKEDVSTKLFIGANATIPNGYTAFFGSGKLAVDENFNGTGNARIYGAMLIKNASGTYNNFVIYTDNFGADWKILGGSTSPIANQDEPKVEILPSGQILFSVRRGGGRQFNVFTYGTGENDKANGVGTWNGNVNGCDNEGSNSTNGEIYCIDAKNASGDDVKLLLQSQPVGGGTWDRENVSIWYKEITDAAYTSAEIAAGWTKGMQVSHQLSAYSTMVLQDDGRIAFFFEEAPCYNDNYVRGYCMVYTPLTIEQITKNKYFSLDFDFDTERDFSVVLTDAQGNEYRDQVTSSFGDIATNLTAKYPFITLGDTPNLESDGENFTYTNTVTLPFKVSNEEAVWHNIYFHTNGENELVYLYANSADDSYVVKANGTANHPYGESQYNTLEKADNMSWAMYHVGNFTFKFKNKLTDKYVKVTGVVSSGNAQNVEYVNDVAAATAFSIEVDASNRWKGDYSLKATGEHIGYLSNTSTSVDYATNYLTNGHQGGWATFQEAPDFTALIAEVNATLGMIGTSLGQYKVTDANAATAETAKEAMQNSNTVKLNDLNTYKGLLDGATLNMPKAGQYFRIRGISGNYIDASSIYNNANATTGQMSMKSAETCNYTGTIFLLDEDNKLKNYHTGTYVKETREIGADVNGAGVWTFTESPRKGGKYALSCTTTNNNGSHLHDNSGNRADRCSSNCGERHDFILEEIEPTTVTINASAGFGTLYAPVALAIPDGLEAYVASEIGNNSVTVEPLEGVIPANTGVLLKVTNNSSDVEVAPHHFNLNISEEPTGEKATSLFLGTVAKTLITPEVGTTCYVLAAKNGNVGLYRASLNYYSDGNKVAQDAKDGTSFYNNAGKAYLPVGVADDEPTAEALVMRFGRGQGTTEIENMETTDNGQQTTVIFDITGRRIEKIVEKGMYIINGKKVLF